MLDAFSSDNAEQCQSSLYLLVNIATITKAQLSTYENTFSFSSDDGFFVPYTCRPLPMESRINQKMMYQGDFFIK